MDVEIFPRQIPLRLIVYSIAKKDYKLRVGLSFLDLTVKLTNFGPLITQLDPIPNL